MTIFTLPGRQRKMSALVRVRLRLIKIPFSFLPDALPEAL